MSTDETLQNVLADLDLPAETYAAVVHDVAGEPQVWGPRIVVWTDRPYAACPRCGQHVGVDMSDAVPVQLNRGDLQDYSQQHGCGQWLGLFWEGVTGTGDGGVVTGEDVARVAGELAERLHDTRQAQRDKTKARLRNELSDALRRLGEPLGKNETLEDRSEKVRTGHETEPGIYEDEQWMAWDYDPDGSRDLIEVREDELEPAKLVSS